MASEMLPIGNGRKRRIMIITGDESIIEQIQNSEHSSLIKSFIIEPKDFPPIDNGVSTQISSLSSVQTPEKIEVHTPVAKKARIGSLTCVVCGSMALGYNFDAITCESCKAFFRRNALKDPPTFQCRRNGGCEITLETRRRCSACRLAKCLSMGMRRERLLTAEEKAAKRREIEKNRSLTTQSHENSDSEKSEILPPELFDELSSFKETDLLCLTDLLSPPSSEPSRVLLTSEDVQRVETIRISYNQRIELAARDGLPWNPSIHTTTLLQHINSRSVSALRLLTFFKQIPEFNQLNVEDKVALVKYNLTPLFILNNTLSYNTETDEIKETDSDVPWDKNILQKVHGTVVYNQAKKIFDSFVRIAQHDQTIIQLALIVLILTKGFSTDYDASEPALNNGISVYRAQNYYTELLWKYMETVHGFEKSTSIFNELVAHFVSWQTLEKELRLNVREHLTAEDKNELLPIMKSLLHIA